MGGHTRHMTRRNCRESRAGIPRSSDLEHRKLSFDNPPFNERGFPGIDVNTMGVFRQPVTLLLLFVCVISLSTASPPDAVFTQARRFAAPNTSAETVEKWGYVPVRKNANMFWWLYHTTAAEGYKNKPLVIWLQGGPGASSTGFGNFEELGPLDVNLDARPTTWISKANVLFIDNPVGTGFSYVTSDDAYTTDVAGIATDLVTLMKSFLGQYTEFQSIPLYIFCESYGGKMTSAFAQALHKSIKAGEVKATFKGVALGDSWISPVDYVMTWGPYLYATTLVDGPGLARINKTAEACKAAFDKGNFTGSTALWSELESVIENETGGVNFYNILKWKQPSFGVSKKLSAIEHLFRQHVSHFHEDPLTELMNGLVRQKLGIIPANVTWGGQSGNVFKYQSGDFMKPVVSIVDDLLMNTDLKVVVFNGQLDLICDTMGTERWIQQLKWPGLSDYNKAQRKILKMADGTPWGYVKQAENLSFFWVLDSGHMVPQDVGEAALKMLEMVIG